MIRSIVSSLSIFGLILTVSTVAMSEAGHHHHEAHQHGLAKLGVVREAQELSLVFQAPASDLVGFEHVAQSKEEKEELTKLESTFKDARKLFVFPTEARCQQVEQKLDHALRVDRSREKEQAHHHSATHSEISVQYRLTCSNSQQLDSIETLLFRTFSSLESIQVSILTPTYQGKQVLRSSSPTFVLAPR